MDEILYNIRKEMLTNMFNDENYRPMKLKELCVLLMCQRMSVKI